MEKTPRYAVYYTPEEGSNLERLGIDWLGRTPEKPFAERPEPPEGFGEEEYRELTASPRHYGFHGTLKAPFELHEEETLDGLREGIRAIARKTVPFEVGSLKVYFFSRFLALVPSATDTRLTKLHSACLRKLDHFRAPLSEYDFERNIAKGLTERQERLLHRFGYPFVMEEFRFHMTLTGNVDEKRRKACKERLENFVRPYLSEPFRVKEICLFTQDDRESPFRLIERFRLKGKVS